MATHSSTLAWKIPWTEEPGRLQIHGVAKSGTRLSDTFVCTLLTKVRLVKAMVFPVVMHGCESWTVKKAEH